MLSNYKKSFKYCLYCKFSNKIISSVSLLKILFQKEKISLELSNISTEEIFKKLLTFSVSLQVNQS